MKKILQTLGQYITKWDLIRCADNHFHRVVYGIGPYIADYLEQVLVAGIVNGWCPAYINLLHLASIIPSHEYSCDVSLTDLNNPNAEPQTSEKMEILL